MAPSTFNTKSPTIKRIMREAAELSANPSPDYHASPLEDDLYTWHFTIRGPSDSAFSQGIYHGRITLPATYPLKPPNFRFLTPSGRFECNREICLSISGFHEEMWQPAWGVRTALLALRGHMDVPAKGQVGGIESDEGTRRRLAAESTAFVCAVCKRSNLDILREQEELVQKQGGEETTADEEEVPRELRLTYREDLAGTTDAPAAVDTVPVTEALEGQVVAAQSLRAPAVPTQQVHVRAAQARQNDTDHQIDAAIWIVGGFLVILVARWLLRTFG